MCVRPASARISGILVSHFFGAIQPGRNVAISLETIRVLTNGRDSDFIIAKR